MAVYIIAEAGVNHNGNIDIAKKLAGYAKQAGCDCVKFQTFSADRLVTRNAAKAEYQIKNTNSNDSQYSMLKRLELTADDFKQLKRHCEELQIDFLATPFDEESADILEDIGVDAFKISSGEITNKPLLQYIASKGKRMLLSTGMSTMEEVRKAVGWIKEQHNDKVTLFHCTSNYPASYESVNMKAMLSLKEEFCCPVGYSDHTEGIEIALLAVALGAQMIEKHFTYDKEAQGPDHKASLDPDELKRMVLAVRHIEAAFGSGRKEPCESELSTRNAARKSLVWKKAVKKGEVITREHICCKRPGTGMLPENMEILLGRCVKRDCQIDEIIRMEEISW